MANYTPALPMISLVCCAVVGARRRVDQPLGTVVTQFTPCRQILEKWRIRRQGRVMEFSLEILNCADRIQSCQRQEIGDFVGKGKKDCSIWRKWVEQERVEREEFQLIWSINH